MGAALVGLVVPIAVAAWLIAKSDEAEEASSTKQTGPDSHPEPTSPLLALPEVRALQNHLQSNVLAARASGDPLWQFDTTSILNDRFPITLRLHQGTFGQTMTEDLREALSNLEVIAVRRQTNPSSDAWQIHLRYLQDRANAQDSSELKLPC